VNILFKTTSLCNANCTYCFDKINQNTPKHKTVMPMDEFKEMFIYICENWRYDINWCWHGGEPLLAGYDWFKEALYFMHVEALAHQVRLDHGMQTNGILINKKWQELFDKYNVAYSISNDGILNEQSRGYPEVRSNEYFCSPAQLGVISPEMSKHLIENYEHLKEDPYITHYTQNWNFPGPNQTVMDVWHSEEELDAAIDRYIEYALYYIHDTNHELYDRTILDFVKVSLGKEPKTCIFINCFASDQICIDTSGNVYKCDELDNPDFFLGHYTEFKSYDEILNHPKLKKYLAQRASWKDTYCKDCDFKNSCSQGCWARASRESNGERPYSLMCKLSKRLLPVLFEELKDLSVEDFAKLNHYVKKTLIATCYIPVSIKEEISNESISLQTNSSL